MFGFARFATKNAMDMFKDAQRAQAGLHRKEILLDDGLTYVYLEGGKIPLLSAKQFEELGYNVVAYGCSGLYATAYALMETYREIFETGETRNAFHRMIPFNDFNELLGLSDIRKEEKKFLK